MKKIFTFLVIAFTLKAVTVQAQTIPNYDFEHLNYDGTISNWGSVYLFPMWVDTNGSSFVDSIVFDNNWFYAPTNDAFLGNTAIELSNAWDYTTNEGIAGSITADTDSVFSSWSSFEIIPIQSNPFNFSFYYKFFPVNSDTALATVQLFDSLMYQIGETFIYISGTVSNYSLATAAVNYTDTGIAAYAYINFRTAAYGTEASFGTRFIIDDVMFNYVTITGIHSAIDDNAVKIYPNPFTDELVLSNLPTTDSKQEIEVYDLYGRKIYSTELQTVNTKLRTKSWQSGIYFVRVNNTVYKVVKN